VVIKTFLKPWGELGSFEWLRDEALVICSSIICVLVSLSWIPRQSFFPDFACLSMYTFDTIPELFVCLSIYENAKTSSQWQQVFEDQGWRVELRCFHGNFSTRRQHEGSEADQLLTFKRLYLQVGACLLQQFNQNTKQLTVDQNS